MNKIYLSTFKKYELNFARCFGSKFSYLAIHSDSLVVFNARIYLKNYYEEQKEKDIKDFFKGQENEIWYGDLDLNKDIYKLYLVALEIRQILVITTEHGQKIIEIGVR